MANEEQTKSNSAEEDRYMADFKKTVEASMKVYMDPTKRMISSVEKKHSFTISSKYKSIDGAKVEMRRSKRGYQFSCPGVNMIDAEVRVNESGYWFFEEQQWESDDLCLFLADGGITNLTMTMENKLSFKGPVREFRQSYPTEVEAYRRLVIRVPENSANSHYRALSSIRFAYGESFRPAGMCVYDCQGVKMRLFNFVDKGFASSLVIDANCRLDHDKFQRIVKATLTVLGAVTGDLHRGERYTIASTDDEHQNPIGLHYDLGRESILTELAWLDGHLWADVNKKDFHLAYLPMDAFSGMVNKVYSDGQYARALWIIAESNAYPFEIRASAYSVALETMKNIISQEKPEAFNPFRSKSAARSFRLACATELHKLPDDAFNNKDAILKRIEQMNQATNSDALEISFRVAGVLLNRHDKRTISMRNDFLHGRIPFENEQKVEKGDTLFMITYKLGFLLSALILRYAGYKGRIRNNYVYAGNRAGWDTGDDAIFR